MLPINKEQFCEKANVICKDFLNAEPSKRYIFGRNEYAISLSNQVEVAGFIDDFAEEQLFQGKPIVKTEDVPQDSLIVSSVMVKPLSVRSLLNQRKLNHVDYFSFLRYSGIKLLPVKFWQGFDEDFKKFRDGYDYIYDLLNDSESKKVYENIINFRLSADLSYMDEFYENQKNQYFEDFLMLNGDDEVFYDIGSYDGYTTLEFIKRCSNYRSAYIFEPEAKNMEVIKARLKDKDNIIYLDKGVSNKKEIVRFSANGSASKISKEGDQEIKVDLLDDIVDEKVSMIKMDIEGEEKNAIEGSVETILKYHPRLAICVYHSGVDIRKIPQQILSIREDYNLYIRHYTEGVTETVMFFIPKKNN